MKKFKIILCSIYLLFAIYLMTISPYANTSELYLNNIGTLFLFLLMIFDLYKNTLGKYGFFGLFLFSVFHSIGSTWLYSFVPYNEWVDSLFGVNLEEYFDFSRNHYDRLVHFSFGVFLLAATKDLIIKIYKINFKSALIIAFLSIQVFSMFYELLEWGIAFSLSEDMAESYNGQQGDMWDAHKDMALAMVGSMISWFVISFSNRKENNSAEDIAIN
ncbi:MAG: hypothetical protein CL846_00950 [Crocinitomicaceae bacterium]|nr:hypothetical protein [Crocinitomicaceae bacterium]